MKNAHPNHRMLYLKRYLLYYLAIIIIPLGVVVFSYTESYQNALSTARENQLKALTTSAQMCDNYWKGAQELAYQLSLNYTIKQYAQSEAPSNENTVIADIYRLRQTLAPYLTTNNYIHEIQICFPKSGTIVTSKSAYSDLNNFYQAYFAESFPRYGEWYDWYFSAETEGFGQIELTYNWITEPYLYFKRTFASKEDGKSASIYILLDPVQMAAPLQGVQKDQTFFVNDEICIAQDYEEARNFLEKYETELIGSSGYFFADMEGNRNLVTYQKSAQADGAYFSYVAEKDIVESLRSIRLLFIIIVTLTALSGIGLAVLFAMKTAAPWLGIVRLLEGAGENSEDFSKDYVNGQIQKIMQSNKSLAMQAEKWQPAVRSALFQRLLFGGFSSEKEIVSEFQKIGIDIQGNFYAVIILTINEVDVESALSELNAYQVVIREYLARNLPNLKGIYAVDIENEALVLTSDAGNYVVFVEELEKQFRAISRYAQDEWNLSISFSGSLANSLERISQCYFEARTAQGYEVKLNNMNITWFKKGKASEKISFYYPVTVEMQLTSAVTKGSREETRRILQRIAAENESLLTEHSDIYLQLLYTMNATVYRIMGENIEIQEQLADKMDLLSRGLKNAWNLEKVYQQIGDIFLDLCQHFTTGLSETQPLYERIMAFIQENYRDHQLSLAMIAEEFQITEIYFSRLFKEKSGKNYSKYVEELRMAEAARLIEETNQPIHVIAEMVGYNSPQSFRRVYKKYFGHTPRGK